MQRICVVRFGAIGDLLMTTPALRVLHRLYPDARITMVVGKGMSMVVADHPAVAEVIEFDKRVDGRPRAFLAFCRRLRERDFDLFVNLQRSVKTVLMGLLCRPARRITYRVNHGKGVDGCRQHTVANVLDALRPLGIEPDLCDRHLDFTIPEAARLSLGELLSSRGLGPNTPLIAVNPGATAPSRRWTPARLGEVLVHLEGAFPSHAVVVCGGKGVDQELARTALSGRATRVVDLTGETTFAETAALLDRADVLVTGDTGPMHLAAAVGATMVALFGPTDPNRTGPMPASPVVRRGRPLPVLLSAHAELDCVPCMSRTCRRGDQKCLALLTDARIADSIRSLLGVADLHPTNDNE